MRIVAMAGLGDTLSKLVRLRRRLEGLGASPEGDRRKTYASGGAGRLREVVSFGSNPGHLRMLAYTPQRLPRAPALVVALHGCTQTAAGYDYGSGWSTLADRHAFALLCPEQQKTNNPSACFSWFHTAHTHRKGGEALSIRQMIEHMIGDHGIDRNRVFIVGLSAGGAMTAAMLAAYPEVFAGGAIIAGLPYGCAASVQEALEAMMRASSRLPQDWGDLIRSASSHRGPWPRLSIWHGSADTIVNPSNAEEIAKQWINVHGLAAKPDLVEQIGGHDRRVWRDAAGQEVIEWYTLSGMGHGVPLGRGGQGANPCGHVGPFHLDAGLSSSPHIAKFWRIADAATASDELIIASASAGVSPSPNTTVVGAPSMRAASPSANHGTTEEATGAAFEAERSRAPAPAPDPRDVITAVLHKAGLLMPAGGKLGADPRAIIARTLRSVGLLKE
jgi:poly(hydroxyalkanoate) depolymerase family esterase